MRPVEAWKKLDRYQYTPLTEAIVSGYTKFFAKESGVETQHLAISTIAASAFLK
jgi:hypothetical protein